MTSVRGARFVATVCAVAGIVLSFGACGPIGYISGVTRDASKAVGAADAANAKEQSPYWSTRSHLYLRQARIEAADADFEAANRFGRIAEEAAVAAKAEVAAGGAPKPPQPTGMAAGDSPGDSPDNTAGTGAGK